MRAPVSRSRPLSSVLCQSRSIRAYDASAWLASYFSASRTARLADQIPAAERSKLLAAAISSSLRSFLAVSDGWAWA
jgi:hypothetical protein